MVGMQVGVAPASVSPGGAGDAASPSAGSAGVDLQPAAFASSFAGVPVPLMPVAAAGSHVAGSAATSGAGSDAAFAGQTTPVVGAVAAPVDPVSIPCDTIARTYRLTAREREVLGLIAHGRNMPFMEQELVISRNTLKMHIRHIYTKLDVHSKQEIIDMVEALIAR